MVTERQRKPSNLFSDMQNKGNWNKPHKKLPKNGKKQPNGTELPTNTESAVLKDRKGISSSRFPSLSTMSLCTPIQTKVSFMPSKTMMKQRRSSVPLEPLSFPPKPILKKRNSLPNVSYNSSNHSDQVNISALWNLPWEREQYFPQITHNGTMPCIDEDDFLVPMISTLKRPDDYTYSEEFMQALLDS